MASPGYQYCASCIGILPCYFAPVGEQSMVMIFDFRCFVSPRERKTFSLFAKKKRKLTEGKPSVKAVA